MRKRARGLEWIGHQPAEPEVPGSSPGGPVTIIITSINRYLSGERRIAKLLGRLYSS